jgi:hypothetical protein
MILLAEGSMTKRNTHRYIGGKRKFAVNFAASDVMLPLPAFPERSRLLLPTSSGIEICVPLQI